MVCVSQWAGLRIFTTLLNNSRLMKFDINIYKKYSFTYVYDTSHVCLIAVSFVL